MRTLKLQSNGPLYSNTVCDCIGRWYGLYHLVQQGGAWAGCGPTQSPPCCTKCNSPPMWPINGQCIPTSYNPMCLYCAHWRVNLLLYLKCSFYVYCVFGHYCSRILRNVYTILKVPLSAQKNTVWIKIILFQSKHIISGRQLHDTAVKTDACGIWPQVST